MFNKLLIKALKKRFKKLSPEEKNTVREMANNETISDTTEKPQKVKRRTKIMADEKEVKTNEVESSKVETENNEVDKDKSTDVVETKEEKVEETDKKEETTNPTEVETTKDEEPTDTTPQVEETEPQGNGIRVEDLVTKDMLIERLAAFEAKLDAVVKENGDLKNELSKKSDELNGIKDKYENKDFGNFQKQGVMTKDKSANSSFDEYSKAFM
jgi:hypothetical protein